MVLMYSSLVRHVKRFPKYKWELSFHPNVTMSVLKELQDYEWNWNHLTNHKNWSWDWIREFPDKPWDWDWLSESPYFTWNWVREFPDKPWDWKVLSIRVSDISVLKEFPDKPWDWYDLTLSPGVKISDIRQTPNLPWNINELLFTVVDEEIVDFIRFYRSHYDKSAWSDHSSRTPWSLVRLNADLPWNFNTIRIRKSEEFQECDIHFLYMSNDWDWNHLSSVLDFKIILKCIKDFPWNFEYVSRNKTVKYTDVLSNPDLPWNYNFIQLDFEVVEWNAANVIKRYWKKVVSDPSYEMCKRVLMKHFEDDKKIFL